LIRIAAGRGIAMRGLEDYCTDLAACPSLDAVGRLFHLTVAREGYSTSACRVIRQTGKGQLRVLFRNWPKNWAKLSEERDYNNRSPVLAAARRRVVPFTWGEISAGSGLPPADKVFWGVVRDWGWSNGFVVPMHGPGGNFSYLGMGTREDDLDLGAERRAFLHMVAVLAHARCHALYDPPAPHECDGLLSSRELECMRWVADGKTDWEIGMILKISSATVRFHVDRARQKLDAVTRPQAIAKLFTLGLL
jgi:DNA-binding CsgD family transcriptional regulator